jgi:hypothetical protein
MIKTLTGSRGIVVTGDNGTGQPYINMNQPSAGLTRYNGNTNNLEIYDGSIWVTLYPKNVHVELDAEIQALVDWARKKREEDLELKSRMELHPGLRDAYEKFLTMDLLTKENK